MPRNQIDLPQCPMGDWNGCIPYDILIHVVELLDPPAAHQSTLGRRRDFLGKMRLLNKTWKSLVDTSVSELSCSPWCPSCNGHEDNMPIIPYGRVVSLLRTTDMNRLHTLSIPTTTVTEFLLESIICITSLVSLELSAHAPGLSTSSPVIEKFSQLKNLESLTIMGSRQSGSGFHPIQWWPKGGILAKALRGIPSLANVCLLYPDGFSEGATVHVMNFIQALPSKSLASLKIFSFQNVVSLQILATMKRFTRLKSLTVEWNKSRYLYGETMFCSQAPGSWTINMLQQLKPLHALKTLEITDVFYAYRPEALSILPHIEHWGQTMFAGDLIEADDDEGEDEDGPYVSFESLWRAFMAIVMDEDILQNQPLDMAGGPIFIRFFNEA